jgi:hypothetical protein
VLLPPPRKGRTETKGRTYAETDVLFARGFSPRKFSTTVTSYEQAVHVVEEKARAADE